MHEIKLQPAFYDYMLNGTKKIEIRLNDEKRKLINIGDTIKVLKEPNLEEFFYVKVIGLLKYDNFSSLINDFDISLLADKSMTKEELLKELNKYYSKEKQDYYNVLGIRVEVLK